MVNPYVSVDCVLLGFDGEQLNVLLIRQSSADGQNDTGAYKLPGSPIDMDEDLDEAAQRVLQQLTGLTTVKMRQFKAFGGLNRLADNKDNEWLQRFYKLDKPLERIVTIGYLSLLRIDRRMEKLHDGYEAKWKPVSDLPHLAFDHNEIVAAALDTVEHLAKQTPTILFGLLPRKFTATQLRVTMECVTRTKYDVKNFHKRMQQMPYVIPLEEKQAGVNHRAARYYKFKKPRERQ